MRKINLSNMVYFLLKMCHMLQKLGETVNIKYFTFIKYFSDDILSNDFLEKKILSSFLRELFSPIFSRCFRSVLPI